MTDALAQLDDVHSILRLSYESLKGLISLASRGVAKLTLCETCAAEGMAESGRKAAAETIAFARKLT
jgi:hypothetical protein